MKLSEYISDHTIWFSDRKFKNIFVHGQRGYKVYQNFYQIRIDQNVMDREFVCMDIMMPLFDDDPVLHIYLK